MGQTSKKLTIIVAPSLQTVLGSQLDVLASQGHSIRYLTAELSGEDVVNADLVLSPNAWRMFPALAKYLDTAIKAARAVAYPAKRFERG